MYIKKILLTLLIISVLVLTYFSYSVYEAVFSPNTSFNDSEKSIYISETDNFDSISKKIEPYLINLDDFKEVAYRKKYTPKAGHFILEKGMNNNEIVNTLRIENIPINITFNNAESLSELSDYLSEQLMIDSSDIYDHLANSIKVKQNNFSPQQALSLYIPNTYQVYWNTSAKALNKKLLKEYDKFWNADREAKRQKLNLSQLEVSVLASIVQKETTKISERPRVAGVYLNRLKRNMKLEADPTVIHAIKEKYNNPDTIIRRVLFRDLKIDSPYNTYKNLGLPPAPLIMPDVSALDAVLNYEKHNFLFFVANINKPGYHIFAKTLSEHNANAAEYRKWINEQKIYR